MFLKRTPIHRLTLPSEIFLGSVLHEESH